MYDDLADIKRVIVHTTLLNAEWLVNYFSRLTVENSMACLQEMMRVNKQQNLAVVVQIATKYSDVLGAQQLIEMFESFRSSDGMYQTPKLVMAADRKPKVSITSWARSSTYHKIQKFISSIFKPPLVLG